MRILIVVPVLIVLIAFALSNQQVVQLGLWPTDITVAAPLSVTILVAAGLFFVIGALMTWGAGLMTASRARQAERTVRQLQAEVRALKAQPRSAAAGTAMALPPPGA